MAHLLLFAFALIASDDNDLPSIEVLEQRILDQKRSIKSCHFLVDSKIWTWKPNEDKTLTFVHHSELWFDENQDSIRYDLTRPSPSGPDMGHSPTRKVLVRSKGQIIRWWQDPTHVAMPVELFDAASSKTKQQQIEIPHPRVIAMAPANFLNLVNFTLQSFVGRSSRSDVKTSREERDGVIYIHVSFIAFQGMNVDYWVRPDQDYTVHKIRVGKDDKLDSEVWAVYEKEAKSGIWFPVKSVYSRFKKGNLIEQEELLISGININTEIDSKVFTPQGFEAPPETKIVDLDNLKRGRDESQMVRKANKIETDEQGSHSLVGPVSLAVLGMLLITFAVYAGYRFVKKQ